MKTLVLLIFLAAVVWSQSSHSRKKEFVKCFRDILGIKGSKIVSELDIPLSEWGIVEKCKKHCIMVTQRVIVNNRIAKGWFDKLKEKVKDHSCPPIKGITKCEFGFKAFQCYLALGLNITKIIEEEFS